MISSSIILLILNKIYRQNDNIFIQQYPSTFSEIRKERIITSINIYFLTGFRIYEKLSGFYMQMYHHFSDK